MTNLIFAIVYFRFDNLDYQILRAALNALNLVVRKKARSVCGN